MFCVYLLKSQKDGDLYIGFTNNLERRIKEHNNGAVASTKSRRPFELIYFEGYKAEKDARHIERNLKLRSRAFAQLKKRVSRSPCLPVTLSSKVSVSSFLPITVSYLSPCLI